MVRKKTIQKIKQVQIERYKPVAPTFEEPPIEMTSRQLLEQRLKNSTFIVAGGAWQHLWDRDLVKQMGFGASPRIENLPSQEDLRSSIKPELLKRFRNEVTLMPAMHKEDYLIVCAHITETLPECYRSHFKTLSINGIKRAVEQKLGMRFFEEILSQVLTSSTKSL